MLSMKNKKEKEEKKTTTKQYTNESMMDFACKPNFTSSN